MGKIMFLCKITSIWHKAEMIKKQTKIQGKQRMEDTKQKKERISKKYALKRSESIGIKWDLPKVRISEALQNKEQKIL